MKTEIIDIVYQIWNNDAFMAINWNKRIWWIAKFETDYPNTLHFIVIASTFFENWNYWHCLLPDYYKAFLCYDLDVKGNEIQCWVTKQHFGILTLLTMCNIGNILLPCWGYWIIYFSILRFLKYYIKILSDRHTARDYTLT